MALLVPQLLAYLIVWSSGVTGFAFTNSFNDWVGNTTYRIDWSTSSSDPSIYDLALVQPRSIYSTGVAPNVSWPDQWSHKYAIQIPVNGDHFIQVALGSDVWPGVYYWRMSSANQTTAVSNTFLISSSSGTTNPTTITSLVPVTATEDVVQTSDGHIVTYKPSDIYSSAVIYTTIIVISDGSGKGAALTKAPIIVGMALALIFVITLPIIVWLVLRYRRPGESSGGKPTPLDLNGVHNSSVLNLMPSNASAVDSTAPHAAPMEATTRRVWAIVDGEKKLVTISQDPLRPTTPAVDSDPFADPSTPTTLKSARRILVPTNASTSDHDSSSSSVNPYDPLLFRANTTTNPLGATFSCDVPSISTHTNSASIGQRPEKTPERAGQRLHLEHHVLSEEEIASRIIVPGRAVDMGPFGKNHIQNVDEDGLLPPDYFQATQPIPSLQSPQAGPSTR